MKDETNTFLKKGFSASFLSFIIKYFLFLIAIPFIARISNEETIGNFGLYKSIIFFGGFVLLLGLNEGIKKYISSLKNDNIEINNILSYYLIIIGFLTLIISIIFYSKSEYLLLFLTIAVFFAGIFNLIRAILFNTKNEYFSELVKNIYHILIFLIGIPLIFILKDNRSLAYGVIFSTIITGLILSVWFFINKVKLKINQKFYQNKKFIKIFLYSKKSFLSISLTTYLMDILLIIYAFFLSIGELGLLKISISIISITLLFPNITNQILIPLFSKTNIKKKREKFFVFLLHHLLILISLMIIALSFFSKEIITIYVGKDYFQSIVYLIYLSPSFLLFPLIRLIQTYHQYNEKFKLILKSQFIGIIIFLILSFLFFKIKKEMIFLGLFIMLVYLFLTYYLNLNKAIKKEFINKKTYLIFIISIIYSLLGFFISNTNLFFRIILFISFILFILINLQKKDIKKIYLLLNKSK